MTMRWDDLRTFLAVAEHGTLAAAAPVLSVDASTVHRRIRALESDLGTTLFERTPRGYALTMSGEALLPKAQDVEATVHAARRVATGHDLALQGTVRITLPGDLVAWLVPHLAEFHGSHPSIRPVLDVGDRLYDLARETDIALRPSAAPPDTAIGRRVGTVRWSVYAPKGADPSSLPWVGFDGMSQAAAVRWWRANHGEAPQLFSVSRVSAMHRAAVSCAARVLLPCYLGDHEPTLVRVGEPVEAAATPLWLLIHADLRRSARVRAVVSFLVPRLKSQFRSADA